jgi:hypothetical protein
VFGAGAAIDVDRGKALDWLHEHGGEHGLAGLSGDYPHIRMAPDGRKFAASGARIPIPGEQPPRITMLRTRPTTGEFASSGVPYLTGHEDATVARPRGPSHWATTVFPEGGGGRELDRTPSVNVNGSGKISVDVKGLTSGSKVSASGEGLFKKTEVSRQTQMEPAKSGPSVAANAGEE